MSTGRDKIRIIGIILGFAWVMLLLLFWWLAPDGEGKVLHGAVRVVIVVGAAMPLFVIWLAVAMADAVARLNEDADKLRIRLSQLRDLTPAPRNPQSAPLADAPLKSATQRSKKQKDPVTRSKSEIHASGTQQTAMQFEAPEPVEITPTTLILALNFPDDAEDRESISAMRIALQDPDLARVLRAAQDVITLLGKASIFMDDLAPSPAAATTWRRFAEGIRGAEVAVIGDVNDEAALEDVSAILRGDEIFRDSTHHFLRHFDRMLARRAAQLDDGQLGVLAETRSAKAFMLLGKAAGIFG